MSPISALKARLDRSGGAGGEPASCRGCCCCWSRCCSPTPLQFTLLLSGCCRRQVYRHGMRVGVRSETPSGVLPSEVSVFTVSTSEVNSTEATPRRGSVKPECGFPTRCFTITVPFGSLTLIDPTSSAVQDVFSQSEENPSCGSYAWLICRMRLSLGVRDKPRGTKRSCRVSEALLLLKRTPIGWFGAHMLNSVPRRSCTRHSTAVAFRISLSSTLTKRA